VREFVRDRKHPAHFFRHFDRVLVRKVRRHVRGDEFRAHFACVIFFEIIIRFRDSERREKESVNCCFQEEQRRNFFCPNTHTRAGRAAGERAKNCAKETIYVKKKRDDDDDDDDDKQRNDHIKSAPLHDFGSNGSKDKTSCGVHPTDKRIVGLSCPNLYPAVVIVFWEEAADFPLNPTMPPVATKPPTSKTFLVLNNALFCFFFLASMITSSLRRDCVSRSLSFLLNVFILLYQNKTRARGPIFRTNKSDAAEEVPPVCALLAF